MRTHIKVVAVVNILYSALGLLGALAILFSGVFGGLFSGSLGGFVGGFVGGIIGSIIWGALSLFGLIAGFGLLNHQQWARYTIILVSAFRLFKFPIGTLFGAYSLWVLLNDESRAIFEVGTVSSVS